jgi:hypothetical protein
MPSRFPEDFGVHGSSAILASRGHEAVHYDHHMVHIKEWLGMAKALHGQSIHPLDFVGERLAAGLAKVCEPRTFVESKDACVGVH